MFGPWGLQADRMVFGRLAKWLDGWMAGWPDGGLPGWLGGWMLIAFGGSGWVAYILSSCSLDLDKLIVFQVCRSSAELNFSRVPIIYTLGKLNSLRYA